MTTEEIGKRSRWMIRAMEWDDPRARYPNIWHEGMPRHILAFERVAQRLRLGDLVAVYHPASQRHTERAERFLGLCRVVGLRRADDPEYGWIDLETAWRLDPPLALGKQPRRVFLCCDPGWPGPEGELFQQVFDAAVTAGWTPRPDELKDNARTAPPDAAEPAGETQAAYESGDKLDAGGEVPAGTDEGEPPPGDVAAVAADQPVGKDDGEEAGEVPVEDPAGSTEEEVKEPAPPEAGSDPGRMFAGVDYSGDMRDPRDRTWLAIVELRGERLRVSRLEPTGRHGLQGFLRDPHRLLMHVEAIGLDFPFGLPIPFAESLLGEPVPEEGWWALARRLEKMSRPEYLVAVQEFRDAHGEIKRLTDEKAGAFSPLHRVNPDLGPMTYHGIRMVAEDRSRFALRPFETAQGKLLLEVYPGGFLKTLSLPAGSGSRGARNRAILNALMNVEELPVDLDEEHARTCANKRDALDAVIAARLTARAVLTGEVDRTADELAPGEGDRVRREGWIYGLGESPEAGEGQ